MASDRCAGGGGGEADHAEAREPDRVVAPRPRRLLVSEGAYGSWLCAPCIDIIHPKHPGHRGAHLRQLKKGRNTTQTLLHCARWGCLARNPPPQIFNPVSPNPNTIANLGMRAQRGGSGGLGITEEHILGAHVVRRALAGTPPSRSWHSHGG